jgi:tripartite-type tricarboxylate transporter receptor subunit TctC
MAFGQSLIGDKLTVVIPYQAGAFGDLVCRRVFTSYSTVYKTDVLLLNQPGADQIVAHKNLLVLTEPAVFCAGSTVIGPNQILNPSSPPSDTLKPVIGLLSFTQFVMTPSDRPGWEELIKNAKQNNKTLIVGGPSTFPVKSITYVLDQLNVKYDVITYRKPFDAVVDLEQKSIDLYADGGTAKNILENGNVKFKEIAHMSTGNKSKTLNLTLRYPLLAVLTPSNNVYVASKYTDDEINTLNKRLNVVVQQSEVQNFYKEVAPYHIQVNGTVADIVLSTKTLQKNVQHVFN